MKTISKHLSLFLVGGVLYTIIETVWKAVRNSGITHWSMFVLGGLCFVLIGLINEFLPWEMGFVWQTLIGASIVTGLEFVTGLIVNIWLGLGVWDYSRLPFNIMGQICLPFFFAWIALSAVAIMLDDYLRYWFFGEEEPYYTLI